MDNDKVKIKNEVNIIDEVEIKEESIDDFITINNITHDSPISCGRCGENMTYEEYTNKHRYKHYNLCWLDGEEKLDYLDVNKIAVLLRKILPKHAERDKKITFICEWCKDKKRSVFGYANHIKKCSMRENIAQVSLSNLDEITTDDKVKSKYDSNSMVICGLCDKSMSYKEYEIVHKLTHYNLCWINNDEKPDFDDENIIKRLLRATLPKYAAIEKKVKFTCEWCQEEKKSVAGFASHIKQCQYRPDKAEMLNNQLLMEELNEKNLSIVTCGRCRKEMTFKEYQNHCSVHYNLCWIDGEEKLDLEKYDDVLPKLRQFIPFKEIRKRSVKLICEDCKIVKKSVIGFASHVIFCNKSNKDTNLLLVNCDICGNKVKPSSLSTHKLKNCKVAQLKNDCDVTKAESSFKSRRRRRRRPPNVLSFHPDTKYVTEFYNKMCRLCDFISMNINDVIIHIFEVHNVDINDIENTIILKEYIIDTYDACKNIYVKPLLNYYYFFRKTFWTTNCHEDFQSDIQLLNNNELMDYLPSVNKSCKILNSNKEEIIVDIFESIYIDGMYWLFTGGPNWAMSWCPVPENIKTQYLAISCHPKPDLEHKEMEIYRYPSLVQLWIFNSLDNINHEVTDLPYMSYGLAHDFGAVWDMAWCPSGAYKSNDKIGLLALSTSCGDCPVFAMPHRDENTKTFHIYKSKPVIARNFECEWIQGGVQCKKVVWQAVSPFKTLICGYSNGIVSVFNINFKSIFLIDDILYPIHIFRASQCSITGLSVNCFNSSILAVTATDGNITLWDLNTTENPIFQKKSYTPSDCTWLQQCYTLVYSSKSVNPIFLKVRTVNFSSCDDDLYGYDPDLYVFTNNVTKNSRNIDVINYDDSDETIKRNKIKIDDENITINNSNVVSDDDDVDNDDDNDYDYVVSKTNSDEDKSNNVVKSDNVLKNVDEEDLYGPTFYQKGTHWSISGSNWMNVFATGNVRGVVYEKMFLPEQNQIKKDNSSTFQLSVKKLSNDTNNSDYSNGFLFHDTIKDFGLELIRKPTDELLKKNQDDIKPLLRYPLDNITKVTWNQNFSSFRWLASGTQSGFTLVSPCKTLPDNYIQSFYDIIATQNKKKS